MAIETFWNAPSGNDLYERHWPVHSPRAVIALVHGQGEHIGRYEHVAQFFNEYGIAILGYDHQGHGQSTGQRGHAASFDSYLDDLDAFLDRAQTEYPNLPTFLYGHSMGGLIVLSYCLQKKPQFHAAIATSPWVRLAFEPNALKVAVGKLLKNVVPGLVMPTGLAAQFISRDEACVERYKNDPLVHGKVSASGGLALMESGNWLNSYAGDFPVPLYMIHGTAYKLTSPEASRELANRLTGDVVYRQYEGLYHETHNEPERKTVLNDTLNWILSKI